MLEQNYFDEVDYNRENPITELAVSEFHECTFTGLDLTGLSFRNSIFVSCKFENCNLSGVDLFSTTLRDIEFKACKIVGANFSVASTLSLLTFKDTILNMSIFHGVDSKGIEFHQCSL